MGAFLETFDQLMTDREDGDRLANEFLFDWIETQRTELYEELLKERPVLEFWSKQPGNPDIASEAGPGNAYLLTTQAHVKKALGDFSMRPTHRSGMFILSIDDVQRHAVARGAVDNALIDSGYVDKIDAAVDEAWTNYVPTAAAGSPVALDVRGFAREAVLRFTGKFMGIPEADIFDTPPNTLELWSLDAFRGFIWKIHARHFVDFDPSASDKALKQIGKLVGKSFAADPNADTFIARLFKQPAINTPHKGVNAVGAIQGLIDNAMTGICYALNQFLRSDGTREAARAARHDLVSLKKLLREAHRRDTVAPFLPRRGSLAELYDTADNRTVDVACAIGAAINDPAGSEPWDIRFGYGMHACVGGQIGDEVMVRALAKILGLENLKAADGGLQKEWGWIVQQYKVTGTQP